MSKTIRWLGVLLGVQLLMAVGFNLPAFWPTTQPGAAPLVGVAQSRINRIVLEGPDRTKIVLTKEGNAWLLPEAEKFPADSNRVNTMLERVTGSKAGLPVATTAGAKTRFRVSDEAFERRITLSEDDKTLATLYLGSSPGPRRSYVRAGGDDAVFALELAPYEVPVQLADWEDKTILQLPKSDITVLEVAGLRIEQSTQPAPSGKQTDSQPPTTVPPAVWVAKGPHAGGQVKPYAVDKLARLLADLTFDKVLSREADQDYGLEKPSLTITLTRKTGETLIYRLGKSPNKEEYTLKVSNRPEYFRLPSYQAAALLEAADHKQLLGTSLEGRAHTEG